MNFEVILFSDSEVRFGFTRSAGTYSIASAIRERGYDTLVVNYSFALTWEKFKNIIDRSVGNKTKIVGFSANWFDSQVDMFPDSDDWREKSLSINFRDKNIKPFVDYIKTINPDTKIILGGFTAHKYIDQKSIDNIFIGYSEGQIETYLESLDVPFLKMPRVISHDVKAKTYNFNLSSIKYTEYDLIQAEELLSVEFSRGCIFKCSFCSFPMIGSKTIDYLKYQYIVYNELLTNYEKWGITTYFIVDDTFNDSVYKLKLLIEIIEKLPFQPLFAAYVRIDLIGAHPEMAPLLKKIGVRYVMYGLETWNPVTSKVIKKGGSREKKIQALKMAKECWGSDVLIVANLIIGLPNDTIESFNNFISWYKEEGFKYIDYANINPFFLSLENRKHDPYRIFVSEIDTKFEEYGYKFTSDELSDKHIDFHGGMWEKTEKDTGDIRTRDQAVTLAAEFHKKITEVQQEVFGAGYMGHFMSIMGFQVSRLKTKFNIKSVKPEEIIYTVFEIDYYPRLIKMLEDRKNNDKRY
jgi:radical SAM superfamily enzyme YgiQ (UPF0313 family)